MILNKQVDVIYTRGDEIALHTTIQALDTVVASVMVYNLALHVNLEFKLTKACLLV
jgi:hypothetical protein